MALGGELNWALAGRSRDKLEAVRAELGPDAASLPLLIADSHDRASLDALVVRTQAVCSTVGPYALHGSDLVAACAAKGTDYCDLTGEVPWMRSHVAMPTRPRPCQWRAPGALLRLRFDSFRSGRVVSAAGGRGEVRPADGPDPDGGRAHARHHERWYGGQHDQHHRGNPAR
jgi:hypothetical protein